MKNTAEPQYNVVPRKTEFLFDIKWGMLHVDWSGVLKSIVLL